MHSKTTHCWPKLLSTSVVVEFVDVVVAVVVDRLRFDHHHDARNFASVDVHFGVSKIHRGLTRNDTVEFYIRDRNSFEVRNNRLRNDQRRNSYRHSRREPFQNAPPRIVPRT